MKVLFIIPFVSKKYARDWDKACVFLKQTLASVRNQSSANYHIMIVSNDLPCEDMLDAKTSFVRTNLTIDHPELPGRRTVDKERKIHWGLVEARKLRPDYIMLLDADDLISRRLVSFVEENSDYDGFVINKGYTYDNDRMIFAPSLRFHRSCGSCYIFRARQQELPQEHVDYQASSHYREFWMVKSHNKEPEASFQSRGYRWRYVPFFAAVYRKQRQSEAAKDLKQKVPLGVLQTAISQGVTLGAAVLTSRWINATLRDEFAGLF